MKSLKLYITTLILMGATVVASAKPVTEHEKNLYYALGVKFSHSIGLYDLSPEAVESVINGVRDGLTGSLRLDPTPLFEPMQQHLLRLIKEKSDQENAKGRAFIEVFKKRKGVRETPMGAYFRIVRPGHGSSPSPKSLVLLHYEGKTVDGDVFDSSKNPETGQEHTMSFPLDRVIPCWREVLPNLKVGAKAQLVCPAKVAYGDRGAPPVIRPGATLVFEVELVKVGR